jgi:hypothetical protein
MSTLIAKPSFISDALITDTDWQSLPTDQRWLFALRSQADAEVVETPIGSNSGSQVDKYLAECGLNPGYPWCAAFQYWGAIISGASASELPAARYAASVAGWAEWAKHHLYTTNVPARGRLFYWLEPSGQGHMGMIRQVVSSSAISTIEGNTTPPSGYAPDGGREGYGVFIKTRNITFLQAQNEHGFIDLSFLG